MGTKGFMLLLASVLVLGAAIGGSFFGGLMIGKGQEAEAAASVAPVPQPRSATSQPAGQTDGQTRDQLRQRFQSGNLTEEEIAQARARFRSGALGGGGDGGGGGGRRGLSGSIESIAGNTVTIETDQGPLEVTIGTETAVRLISQGSLDDLTTGMTVTVAGQRGEDGSLEASAITVVPEGAGGLRLGGGARP